MYNYINTYYKGENMEEFETKSLKTLFVYKLMSIIIASVIGLCIIISTIISIVGTDRFNNIKTSYKDCISKDTTWVQKAFANSSDDDNFGASGFYDAYIYDMRVVYYNNNKFLIFDLQMSISYDLYDNSYVAFRSEEYYLKKLNQYTFIDDLEKAMRNQFASNNLEGFEYDCCFLGANYNGDYFQSSIECQRDNTQTIRERVYRQTKNIVSKHLTHPYLAQFPDLSTLAFSKHGDNVIINLGRNLYLVGGYVNSPDNYYQYKTSYYSCLIESINEYSYYEGLFVFL